ncbi:MAG: hypothetical protein ACXADB_03620 [Candidatus Hermodarchaeia archaeon]|jgi:hypothetical protein
MKFTEWMELREQGVPQQQQQPGLAPPQGQLTDQDLEQASDEQLPAMIQQRFDNLLKVLDSRTLQPELQDQMINSLIQKLSARKKITQQRARTVAAGAAMPQQAGAGPVSPAPAAPAAPMRQQ